MGGDDRATRPAPAPPSAPSPTCRPNKSAAKISTRAPTSFPSAPSSTKWPPAACLSRRHLRRHLRSNPESARPLRRRASIRICPPKLERIINKSIEKDRGPALPVRRGHALRFETPPSRYRFGQALRLGKAAAQEAVAAADNDARARSERKRSASSKNFGWDSPRQSSPSPA